MSTGVVNRLAALGIFAIAIANKSGEAAVELLQRGIQPPIGNGNPVEVFTLCGTESFQRLINADMMPAEGPKLNVRLQFQPMPHLHQIASWENDAGDRRVVTLYSPDLNLYLTICLGTEHMKRPIQSHSSFQASLAHSTLVRMVRAGQL